ncbi:MAG: hypothetical protein Q4P66_06555 [Actinomycetaceae bacterium]|nr:hypothetical protein [Actinomycetaceae bacterium]
MGRLTYGLMEPRETGECVSHYDTFEKALAASSTLYAADFPPQSIKIVGHDLVTVDSIRGKLTPGKMFFNGVVSATFTLLFGTVFLSFLMPSSFAQLLQSPSSQLGFFALLILLVLLTGLSRAGGFYIVNRSASPSGWRLRTVRQVVPTTFKLCVTENAVLARQILTKKGQLHPAPPAHALSTATYLADRNVEQVHTHTSQNDTVPNATDTSGVTDSAKQENTSAPHGDQPTEFGSRADEKPKFGVRLPRDEHGRIIDSSHH